MTYTTVYNLSINSNYRILAAELNYRFTVEYDINVISCECLHNNRDDIN